MPADPNIYFPVQYDAYETIDVNASDWKTSGVTLSHLALQNKMQRHLEELQAASGGGLNAIRYGFKADGAWISGISVGAGQVTLTTPNDGYVFDATKDLNKSVSLEGGYQAGADLVATIIQVNASKTAMQVSVAAQDNIHRTTGTLANGTKLKELNISAGSQWIQSGTATLDPSYVGMTITMKQGLRVSRPFDTRITQVNGPHTVTLAAAPPASITAGSMLMGTNNAVPLQSAVNAAIALGKKLILPSGLAIVDFHSAPVLLQGDNPGRPIKGIKTTPHAASGRSALYIQGQGKEQTTLQMLPRDTRTLAEDPSGFNVWFFYASTSDQKIVLEDLGFSGPSTVDYVNSNFDGPVYFHQIMFHQPYFKVDGTLNEVGDYGDENLVVWRRVKARGFFFSHGSFYDSNGDFCFEDCDLQASWADGLRFFDSFKQKRRRLHLFRNLLTGGSVNYEYGGYGSVIYATDNVSVHSLTNKWRWNWRAGLRLTSSGGDKGNPEFQIVIGDDFDIMGNAIQTPPVLRPAQIVGCIFHERSTLVTMGQAKMTGCTFFGDFGTTAEDIDPDFEVSFHNCTFIRERTGQIIGDHAAMSVTLIGCEFYFKRGCDTGSSITRGGNRKRLKVKDCRIFSREKVSDEEGAAAVTVGAPFLIYATDAAGLTRDVVIEGCEFEGSFQYILNVQGDGAATGTKVLFRNNDLRIGVAFAFSITNCFEGVVTTEGNTWNGASLSIGGPYVGWQRFRPNRKADLTPRAAQSNLSLDKDHDFFILTGTVAIDTIRYGTDDMPMFGDAIIRLLLPSTVQLVTGGNILPLNVNNRFSGEIVELWFDGRPEVLKWREVGPAFTGGP
jgi:hypothetical protein